MKTPRVRIGVLVLAAIAVSGGCASGRSGHKSTAHGPAKDATKYQDPVAASALREQALDLLVDLSRDPNPQVRANSLEAMSLTPGRLQSMLPGSLRDENAGVRASAAMMVGKTRLADLAPALRPLLSDGSPFVRASTIYALVMCKVDVDPSPLAELLLNDPSPRVRAHAAFLLGEIGEPSALGPLHEAAKSSMPRAQGAEVRLMRLQLAEAMVKLGEEDQLSTIRAALYPARPEDLEAAALAVQIIGQVRDKGSVDELMYLTARQDKTGQKMPAEIRLGCAAALGRIGHTEGSFIPDEFAGNPLASLRAQAAFTYGEIGRTENLPRLETLMRDPDGTVRVAAAAAVLRITTPPGK